MSVLKLRAPAGITKGGLTVGGVFVEIEDGIAQVTNPDHVRELMSSHGFTAWTPPAETALAPADDEDDDPNADLVLDEHGNMDSTTADEIFLGMVPKMPRPAVLATLKASGTAYTLPQTVDQLRTILADVVRHRIAAAKAGQDVPPLDTPEAQKAAETAAAANAAKAEKQSGDGTTG